jgi:uncharacterized protein YerC
LKLAEGITMKGVRTPDALRDKALEMYRAGRRLQEIVTETGLAGPTISNLARNVGMRRQPTRPQASPSARRRAVEMYAQGYPIKTIAAETGIHKTHVCALARSSGLSRHASCPRNGVAFKAKPLRPISLENTSVRQEGLSKRGRLTADVETRIIELYKSGLSATDAGFAVGKRKKTVLAVIRAAGIEEHDYRDYTLNQNYFAEIDTPEKARILGLITADGCIRARNERNVREGVPHVLSIALQSDDEAHLVAVGRALGYNGPLRRTQKTELDGQIRRLTILEVCSERICADLMRCGLTPRKSLTCKPWGGPEHLMRHYWGGMVDGDGHLGIKTPPGKKYQRREFGLTGTWECTTAWCKWVESVTGDRKTPYRKTTSHGTAMWYGCYTRLSTVQTLSSLLYTNLQGSVPLARKEKVAQQMLASAYRKGPCR